MPPFPFLPHPWSRFTPSLPRSGFGLGGSCTPARCSRRLAAASPRLVLCAVCCVLCFPKARRHLTSFSKAASSPGAVPGAGQPSPPSRSQTRTRTPTHIESPGWEVARKQTVSPPAAAAAAPCLTNTPALALESGFTSLLSAWTMISDDVT